VFSGVSQQWEFEITKTNGLQTNRVEKLLKKSTKNPNPISPGFVLSRFWAFLGERGQNKHDKKIAKKMISPDTFLAT
jgi:hypothetical protein